MPWKLCILSLIFFLKSSPTGTLCCIHVDSTWILSRHVKDQISTIFRVISAFFFNVFLMVEKSTLFALTFFNVILLVEQSALFPRNFFDAIFMVEKFTFFLRTFFDVIAIVEKSTLFPHTFFNVILMVEKSTLFLRTPFDVNFLVEKFTLFPRTFIGVIPLVQKSTLFPQKMLESLAGCLTELCTSDFYWIFFHFGFLWYSSFINDFPRFYKPYFRPMEILLLRYSQNNYRIWLHKLNLMCEELAYQIKNISAVNQAVFCYH